jgi:hypothetical protein
MDQFAPEKSAAISCRWRISCRLALLAIDETLHKRSNDDRAAVT